MSKYTDAIDSVKVSLRDDLINSDMFFPSETRKVFLKALEIADRLEQADAELHDTILYDLDRTVGIPNSDIFMQGYSQALADVRGDTE